MKKTNMVLLIITVLLVLMSSLTIDATEIVVEEVYAQSMSLLSGDIETGIATTSTSSDYYDEAVYEEQQYLNSILGDRRNQGAIFDKSGSSYINSATGALHYSSTDLYLPGKAGLDVTVNRVYDSALQTISDIDGEGFDATRNKTYYPTSYKDSINAGTYTAYKYVYEYNIVATNEADKQKLYVAYNNPKAMQEAENDNNCISLKTDFSSYGITDKSRVEISSNLLDGFSDTSTLYLYEDIVSNYNLNILWAERDTEKGPAIIKFKYVPESSSEKYLQYVYTYHPTNDDSTEIHIVFDNEQEMLAAESSNNCISVVSDYATKGEQNIEGMSIPGNTRPNVTLDSTFYFYKDIKPTEDATTVQLERYTQYGAAIIKMSYTTITPIRYVVDPQMGTQIGNGWRIQMPYAEKTNEFTEYIDVGDPFRIYGTIRFTTEKGHEMYVSYRREPNKISNTNERVIQYINDSEYVIVSGWSAALSSEGVEEYYNDLSDYPYNLRVTDPEGTTRYYHTETNRMVAIEDRFDNSILYKYSGDRLSTITDTYGRVIRFTYDADGYLSAIHVLTAPSATYSEPVVSYECTVTNNAAKDPNGNLYTDNVYTLNVYRGNTQSTDKTTYVHKLVQNKMVVDGIVDDGIYSDWRMLLTEVQLSDDTKKVYEYDTKDVYFHFRQNDTQKQKVSKTYYLIDDEKQMETTYSYNHSNEGLVNSNSHYTIITSPNGTQKDSYNSKQQLTESRALQDGVLYKTNYTYRKGMTGASLITQSDAYQISATSVDAEIPETRMPVTTRTYYIGGLDKLGLHRVGDYSESYTYGPYAQLQTHTVNGGTADRSVNLITTYTFSSNGKTPASMTVSGTDLRSRTQSYTYNTDGTLASVTYDEDEDTTTYTYTYPELNTEVNNLNDYSLVVNTATTGFRAVSDHTTSKTYDMLGRAVRATDANGNTYTTTYNISGDVLSQTNLTLNSTNLYSYDYENNIITATDPNGNRVKQTYDGLGRYTASYALDGETWVQMDEVTYDNRGRISTNKVFENTDGDYTKIEYTFNDGGKILEQKEFYNDELKAKQQYTYTLFDIASDDGTHTGTQIKTRTYKTNNQHFDVTQKYNELGFMTSQTTPDTGTTTYTYDKVGNVLSVTDEKGTVATYTYNGVNQPRTVKDALGNTTTNYYDAYGNMYATQAPNGFIMNYAYSPRNELVSQAYDEGETTVWHNYWYDGNGNMIKEGYLTNPFEAANEVSYIHYTYDANNNVTKVSQNNKGDSTEVNYTYDKGGRMLTQTVGNTGEQSTTTYTYNFLNQPVTVTDALGDSVTYVYNLDGTVKSMTDRKGISTAYTYEGANRLTQKTAGNLTATYNYDMMNNRVGASITQNGTQQTSSAYTYNNLGWLTKEVTDGVTKNYTYDKRGNRLSFSMPNYSLSYVYDNANRLTTVKQGNNTIASYTYDVNNRLTKSVLGNGVTTDYTYNNAGWTTNVTASNGTDVLSNISYTYFTDGNVATKTEDGVTTSYTYDGLNRLKTETVGNNTMTYSYDSRGNRTALTVTGEESFTVINTFDKNNKQLTGSKVYTASEVEELTSYSYDENGNLVSEITETYTSKDGTTPTESELTASFWTPQQVPNVAHYEYDAFNRLVEFRGKGTEQATYTYTADGLRKSKTINGKTTNQIWDGMNLVKDGAKNYYYGLDLISNGSQYYVHNAHGDVAHLTNSGGESVKHYTYDAFGIEQNIDNADTNPFRYCGEYYDAESDSIYLRARYYTPNTGRFTQEDPIRDGNNWYVYCESNPIMFVDPLGLDPFDHFSTRDEAARDFGLYIGQKSFDIEEEFAAYIYKGEDADGNSYYFYDEPRNELKSHEERSISFYITWDGKYGRPVAATHTHGAYDANEKNTKDGFSSAGYVASGNDEMSDAYWSDKNNMDYYVITPNGNMRLYISDSGNYEGELLRSDMLVDRRIQIHQHMQNTLLWTLLQKNFPKAKPQDYINAMYNNPDSLLGAINELERYR